MTSSARSLPLLCPKCDGYFADAVFCPRDGARLVPAPSTGDPYIGSILGGDIEVRGLAGAGAMGRVYRAYQRSIERDVAVKILHGELSGNAQLVRRFHREAKIASKLRHPHVVDMHMVGQLGDGSLYIVMEFLDGSSLAEVLARAGKLNVRRAIGIVLQVAGAVGEGHALGIVHRDLKPENVMLVSRGALDDWAKVLDFGIARVEIGDQSMETAAGGVLGTARYISPEGAAGAQVGPPGDVYALATMLYQMLAGRTPFEAPAPLGLLVKHVHDTPMHITELAPEVPEPIAQLIMENLAKAPEARAPNGRAFAAALSAAASAATSDAPYTVRSRTPELGVPSVARDADLAHRPTLYDSRPRPLPAEDATSATIPLTSPQARIEGAVSASQGGTSQGVEVPTSAPIVSARPVGARKMWGIALAAFTLGAAVSGGLVVQSYSQDRERSKALEQVRRALADGHYVTPPGANVKELVEHGFERWPNDTSFHKVRSDAQHEMMTLALTATNGGDLLGAAELAEAAAALDPTDNATRLLSAQARDAVAAVRAGTQLEIGAPRMLFEAPALARSGAPVSIMVRFVRGAAGADAKIEAIRVSVSPNGQAQGEIALKTTRIDDSRLRIDFVAPAPGRWDVSFGATLGGVSVRALRDLDVVP